MEPTTPGELADEESDPHHRPRPSFPPAMVSSVCFIFNQIFTHSTKIARWGEEVKHISWIFVSLSEPRKKHHHFKLSSYLLGFLSK